MLSTRMLELGISIAARCRMYDGCRVHGVGCTAVVDGGVGITR